MVPMILILGSKPSRKNKHAGVPFVGTQSYKRLMDWLFRMDVDISGVQLSNADKCEFRVLECGDRQVVEAETHFMHFEADKIIALGLDADKFLRRNGVRNYYRLPHPSGLNRLLNDEKFVRMELRACQKYLEAK